MEEYRWNRGIALLILGIGNRLRWAANFTPEPLYPQEIIPLPTERETVWFPKPVWSIWRK
jgi:hypothetical protein